MAIVGAFDIHRRQVTFDYLDTASGQVRRGRIEPACRLVLRRWLERFADHEDVTFAVEGCTGWRFVVEELHRAGIKAQLAEPAETAHQRGPKYRAKTDRTDARLLRKLVAEDRVPQSWIPPAQVNELRALLQLYRDLREEHTAWTQRIHATLFHQGVPSLAGRLSDPQVRAGLRDHAIELGLSPRGALAVAVALRMMDRLEAEMAPVHAQITAFARHQVACRALEGELYGVGWLVAAIVWAFLGDTRRFSSSDKAVRHTGLDITVYSSDDKRTPGHLSHQGPPILRWALFEAGHHGSRISSPDHAYYCDVRDRIDANRAALSVARKLTRRAHHILRRLGDQAFAPVGDAPVPDVPMMAGR
jgi:transposase